LLRNKHCFTVDQTIGGHERFDIAQSSELILGHARLSIIDLS
jgi:hypothetical protein